MLAVTYDVKNAYIRLQSKRGGETLLVYNIMNCNIYSEPYDATGTPKAQE